ncbi:transcriptional regulator with XRE-family HTH domain [Streptomyces sp. V3I8]|uniref:helix-turn-helix transcriptional regulator n=1 Tax=Streptomyces sp. V3I8 TaxID=3042279 RepID=UPI00277E445F|nr:helix-turn-helix transcriptional regulator [Streptomyces sp. V3I8]MDQ1033991.1 transcriptional regulator with XRE-family HTH domain [Streptomyces sp. V3I8]
MDHAELGRFLRTRREALLPSDVGLTPGDRRRTPGLRRAEVALLADVSVDYYERLEQSRGANPSEVMLAGLARALRLTSDERDYLYRLAGHAPPAGPVAGPCVEPGLRFLLDSLTTVPAHIVDDLAGLVAQNELSTALFGPWTQRPGRQANAVWRWFTEPDTRMRDFGETDEATGRAYVAGLRAAAAARGHDVVVRGLITDLSARSAEFAAYWEKMEVEPNRSTTKTLHHPQAGALDVHCEVVVSATNSHRLIVLRPEPGSGTAERFEALRVQAVR